MNRISLDTMAVQPVLPRPNYPNKVSQVSTVAIPRFSRPPSLQPNLRLSGGWRLLRVICIVRNLAVINYNFILRRRGIFNIEIFIVRLLEKGNHCLLELQQNNQILFFMLDLRKIRNNKVRNQTNSIILIRV